MARSTADTARVLAVSAESVTLDLGAGGTETIPKMRHVTCAAGDLAQVQTVGRARYVAGVIGAGTAPSPEPAISTPPPAPQDATSGEWPFGVVDAGTYRDGWRLDTADLWQGRAGATGLQYGAAWYGVGPQSLPGVLVGVTVELVRTNGPSELTAPRMVLYAGAERPLGQPVVLAAADGPLLEVVGDPVGWPVPASWLQYLDSGLAAGIGCRVDTDGPLLSLSSEGSGMSINCEWEDRT